MLRASQSTPGSRSGQRSSLATDGVSDVFGLAPCSASLILSKQTARGCRGTTDAKGIFGSPGGSGDTAGHLCSFMAGT